MRQRVRESMSGTARASWRPLILFALAMILFLVVFANLNGTGAPLVQAPSVDMTAETKSEQKISPTTPPPITLGKGTPPTGIGRGTPPLTVPGQPTPSSSDQGGSTTSQESQSSQVNINEVDIPPGISPHTDPIIITDSHSQKLDTDLTISGSKLSLRRSSLEREVSGLTTHWDRVCQSSCRTRVISATDRERFIPTTCGTGCVTASNKPHR